MPSGYYYFGGYDMNAKEITVLMVEPGQHPKITTLKDDLDSLQKAVSIGSDYRYDIYLQLIFMRFSVIELAHSIPCFLRKTQQRNCW